MAFCVQCGAELASGAKFCAYCGAQVAGNGTGSVYSSVPVQPENDYGVVLIGQGSCSLNEARDVLEDLLGYTASMTTALLTSVPVELCRNMTQEQAACVAQALAEYEMEVSVIRGDNYVDVTPQATQTVYNENGSLTNSVLSVLGTLTAANLFSKVLRWTRPQPRDYLFRPRYTVRRPVHMRRNVGRRMPEPAPRQQPVRRSIIRKPAEPAPRRMEPARTARPVQQGTHAPANQPAQSRGRQPAGGLGGNGPKGGNQGNPRQGGRRS